MTVANKAWCVLINHRLLTGESPVLVRVRWLSSLSRYRQIAGPAAMWPGDWLCRSVAEGPWKIPKSASFNGARITVIADYQNCSHRSFFIPIPNFQSPFPLCRLRQMKHGDGEGFQK